MTAARYNNIAIKTAFGRIFLHLALFTVFWLILLFVVIPWDTSGYIPPDAYALIEGQKAYAKIIREKRPTLVTSLRGLNMVKATYKFIPQEYGRCLEVGNARIFFGQTGEFLSLVINNQPVTEQ